MLLNTLSFTYIPSRGYYTAKEVSNLSFYASSNRGTEPLDVTVQSRPEMFRGKVCRE